MTSCTEGVTTEGISQLVLACKEAGVRDFEGLGVKFSFGPPKKPELIEVAHAIDPLAVQDAHDALEAHIKDEELEEMRLRDPAAFEEAIRQNDLEIA